MRKLLTCLVTISLLASLAAGREAVEEVREDMPSIAGGNNAFALDIYAKLKEQEGNLFFSPFSISTALAMTYAGARGETAQQMERVLHFELEQERLHGAFKAQVEDLNARQERGSYQLSVASSLWGQKGYGFLDEFLKLTRENYGAGLRQVDFETDLEGARQRINGWVEGETRGKIKDLIPRGLLNELTRLVLTNAIYFKARWACTFDEEATREKPFTLLDGKKVNVPMMRQTDRFGYGEYAELKVLELPYVRHELSMVVMLPAAVDGLPKLEKALDIQDLNGWLKELRSTRVEVEMPRFRITSKFSLGGALQSMGMTDAFSPRRADLSGMNGRRDLFIQAALHKAYVDVDEQGTEAAAATGIVAGITAAPPVQRPKQFHADHPFLFLIRDNRSGTILFLGRVVNLEG